MLVRAARRWCGARHLPAGTRTASRRQSPPASQASPRAKPAAPKPSRKVPRRAAAADRRRPSRGQAAEQSRRAKASAKPARRPPARRPRRSPAAKRASTPDAAIPPAERLKIQAALIWTGDYTGADRRRRSDGSTAIKNFQKRHKAKVTGVLTPSERADLLAAAKAHEDEFGWSMVDDPATGVRIGLPAKLVPQARDAARGTRWSSAHGEVQVETFRIKQPALTLAAVFEQREEGAGHPPGRIPARCTTTISSSAACRA